MTYLLYIKRSDPDRQREILLDDWLALVEEDQDFSFIVNEGDSASAIFQATGEFEHMTWLNGDINVDRPSEQLLNKMVSLAESLDAEVVGASGETYPETVPAYLSNPAAG